MDFSITNLLELVMQIGVSFIIGTLLITPIILIYIKIKNIIIKKRVPINDIMKGGENKNVIQIKKERNRTITERELREYGERKYFGSSTGNRGDNRNREIENRTQYNEIKRVITNTGSFSPGNIISNGGLKPNTKRDWKYFN
jgi:hypothetical protein